MRITTVAAGHHITIASSPNQQQFTTPAEAVAQLLISAGDPSRH